jgi:hypothetical protein
LQRLIGGQKTKITAGNTLVMMLIAFVLVISSGIGPFLPKLMLETFMVVMLVDTLLLALMIVRRIEVWRALLALFTACQVLVWFAIGTSTLGSSAPAALVIVAGYGVALSMAISLYTFAQLIKINIAVKGSYGR